MANKNVYINGVVTPVGVFSFPHLGKPDTEGQYADDKYKATLLIDKSENIDVLKNAVKECIAKAFPTKNYSFKDLAHPPIRDGDTKTLDGYEGCYFLCAKTKKHVRCVGPAREDISAEEVYAGAKGRLVLTVGSYEQAGKPGVTFYLELVQKLEDGEAIGGGGGGGGAAALSALDDDISTQPSASASGGGDDEDDMFG